MKKYFDNPKAARTSRYSFISALVLSLTFNFQFIEIAQSAVKIAPDVNPPPMDASKKSGERIKKKNHRLADNSPKNKKKDSRAQKGPDNIGTLESVRQKVELQSADGSGWKKAQNGIALNTADQIRTGNRSVARVRLGDGSKVLILQNSQAEIENLSSLQRTIKLLKGRLRAIVTKLQGENSFKIKTPVGVASVRGTDFEVEFIEDGQNMSVEVASGQVGVSRLGDLADEVLLNAGEKIKFGIEGELGDPIRSGALPLDRMDVRTEVQDTKVKESVVAMAAEELKGAEIETGKDLIDANGSRVRVDSYIMRPTSNQFKLVVLNERKDRFDYFTYKGTFNRDLPTNIADALKQVSGQVGASPDYYLTGYESEMSNTIDAVRETATGGHLVKITFDGSKYTLTDSADPTNTRTVDAASLQLDSSYRIYHPGRDAFESVEASKKDDALKEAAYDPALGAYRNMVSGDTLYKTRFNEYALKFNDVTKIAFSKKSTVTNVLALDFDSTFSHAAITSISEFPSGKDKLHNRITLYFPDGSKIAYNNRIIDDEGAVGDNSDFSGLSNSADYKNELEQWNYQTEVTATEFGSRKIDLVVDPKIGTKSGLIQ